MDTIYIYKSHAWYWFYLSGRKLTSEELYCKSCDDSDWLIGVYSDRKLLQRKLNNLWKGGWTLLVTEKNREICDELISSKYLRPPYADIAL